MWSGSMWLTSSQWQLHSQVEIAISFIFDGVPIESEKSIEVYAQISGSMTND